MPRTISASSAPRFTVLTLLSFGSGRELLHQACIVGHPMGQVEVTTAQSLVDCCRPAQRLVSGLAGIQVFPDGGGRLTLVHGCVVCCSPGRPDSRIGRT
ncbi:hypothetical protein OUZ56_014225 [Daphnia magna]|uniref:Secreted protein n=1 Tax=Daphnia magna TaxID=35525 RepID=A0ABQ9Z864_9CRUS|nr:hypothetical protein OUZ56_014225 [Daphnia magna]